MSCCVWAVYGLSLEKPNLSLDRLDNIP